MPLESEEGLNVEGLRIQDLLLLENQVVVVCHVDVRNVRAFLLDVGEFDEASGRGRN